MEEAALSCVSTVLRELPDEEVAVAMEPDRALANPFDPSEGFLSTMRTNVTNPGTFTAKVQDNNGDPTTVLDSSTDFKIVCDWSIVAAVALVLNGTFELTAYAESIGPGDEKKIASKSEAITGALTYGPIDLVVPAGTLKDQAALDAAGESGTYKLVTVLTHRNTLGKVSDAVAIEEGPIVRIS
jgi:hypothetical protein